MRIVWWIVLLIVVAPWWVGAMYLIDVINAAGYC